MHQPNGAQTASPRRHDGATTSARNSAQSAVRADSTSADHWQQREGAHVNGRGGSAPGDVEGQREVQGGGYRGGRGSDDSAMNDASGESRQLALRTLTTDESRQRPKRLENESYNSPEPLKPPDKPALQRTESPSAELEGESRAASSCDVGPTRDNADASRALEDVEDAREWPTKLPNASELERKRSERKEKRSRTWESSTRARRPGRRSGRVGSVRERRGRQ